MSSEHEPESLTLLAETLRALKPQPAVLARDALMFRAGQAQAQRGWLWPGVSAGLLLVCAGLMSLLTLRPQTVSEERIVRLPAPTPAPPPSLSSSPAAASLQEPASDRTEAPAGTDYLRLRKLVVDRGVEALPAAPAWSAQPWLSPSDPLLDGMDYGLQRRSALFSRGAS